MIKILFYGHVTALPQPCQDNGMLYQMMNVEIAKSFDENTQSEIFPVCIRRGLFDQLQNQIQIGSRVHGNGRLQYIDNSIVIMAEQLEII